MQQIFKKSSWHPDYYVSHSFHWKNCDFVWRNYVFFFGGGGGGEGRGGGDYGENMLNLTTKIVSLQLYGDSVESYTFYGELW